MGKKLPKPKRHFGVRDPLKQLEEREEKIKDKINNPPAKDENQQKLSQKMRKFVELKNQAKGIPEKPQKKKKKDKVGEKSQMQRRPQETEESYLKRLSRLKNERLTESLYAAKYNVKITRNEKTGEMQVNQGKKNEIDELLEQKKNKKFRQKTRDEGKLTPLEKLKLKKLTKLEKQLEQIDPSKPQREIIPFGERVDAPPSLVVPRKAAKDEAGNPIKRNSSGLLIHGVLKRNQEEMQKQKVERERENIVSLYKEFKKKKRLATKATGMVQQRNEKGMSSL